MKRIPKTPQRAKRGSKVDDLRFNAQKRSSKVDDLRFKSSVFWPFPKPKIPEQWWWLATRSGGLPRPLQKEGSQKSLQTTVNNTHPHAPLLLGDWGDWGLQSSHRYGCDPTKGSESLIRDGGLQSSHRRGCGPTKGSEFLILSPLRSESGKAERATEGKAGEGLPLSSRHELEQLSLLQ